MLKNVRQSEKKSSSVKDMETPQETASSPLPLFFKSPLALSLDRHQNAGIRPREDFSFARNTNSVPLNVVEFAEAAKYYPIAFSQNNPVMPVAILGLEQNNYFVDEEGKWRKDIYIPAYVRKYPFVFTELAEEDKLVLCVDESAPHFVQEATGQDNAFYKDGAATDYTNNVLEFCRAFQQEYVVTRRFCQILEEADLLMPNQSNVELNSGRKLQLGGFQLINQEKFLSLPDDKILELHRQGWLPLIHYAFMATSNWGRLVNYASE